MFLLGIWINIILVKGTEESMGRKAVRNKSTVQLSGLLRSSIIG